MAGPIDDFLKACMKRWPDKMARLRDGFYSVKDKNGVIVPFRMNADQEEFIRSRHGMDVVLKARQKGFTTIIQIDMLDDCLFIPNIAAGVIAHRLDDAKAFFRDKIKFAYDQLPSEFRAVIGVEQDAADSLRFSNGSSIRVGISLRSGTLQRLHVSEFGKLCAKHPEKAKEVKSGAFNTVQIGQQITVESTAEGQGGEFYEMCQRAEKMRDAGTELTALDFKFHFSPWWTSPEYRLSGHVKITTEMQEYFDKLETQGVHLDQDQRNWYAKKSEQQGEEMKREYPSTAKESFEVSVEGAYFSVQMKQMRQQGRICRIPILDAPVYTTWDLGLDDAMAICFWQDVGMERRLIDYYESSGEGFGHYARILREKGYSYSAHYMPHDAQHRMLNQDATSRKQEAEKAGIKPVIVMKRIATMQDGIEASRRFFPNVYVDEVRCDRVIKCLDSYRKEWNEKLGRFSDQPLHDWSSHGYKSFETAAIRKEVVARPEVPVSIPSMATAFNRR